MGNWQLGCLGVEDLASNGELDCVCFHAHVGWGFLALCCQGAVDNQEVVSDLNLEGVSRYFIY